MCDGKAIGTKGRGEPTANWRHRVSGCQGRRVRAGSAGVQGKEWSTREVRGTEDGTRPGSVGTLGRVER